MRLLNAFIFLFYAYWASGEELVTMEVEAYPGRSDSIPGEDTRPPNPKDHPAYRHMPPELRELVDIHGYDIPKDKVKKIKQKHFNPLSDVY